MATKTRRSSKSTRSASVPNETVATIDRGHVRQAIAEIQQPTFKQLVLMNALFATFCLLQGLIIKITVSEFRGLIYFFMLLYLSFAAVTVLDYIIHRQTSDNLDSDAVSTEV